MNDVGNTNLQLTNVHENKAKNVHKIEGILSLGDYSTG